MFTEATTNATLLFNETTNATLLFNETTNATLLFNETTNATLLFNETTNATLLFNETILPLSNLTNQTGATGTKNIGETVKLLGYITLPLFSFVGLCGNILTLIIMSSKYFRPSTTSVYLSALAVSDSTFILVCPFTKSFVKQLIGYDVTALTLDGCRAFFCFFRTAKICSSWFVVLICIERFVVIWFPFKAKIISIKRTAIIAVLTVTIVVFVFDGVWTITSNVINGVCLPNTVTPSTKELSAAFVVAGTTIFNIIPTIVLLLFTPLTIVRLYKQQTIRREMSTFGRNTDVVRITKTLICVMIAFIILATPISVAHSVAFFNGDNIFESTNADFILFREAAQVLEQLNYSINFFLYVVSNATFRQKLIILLGCGNVHAKPADVRGIASGELDGRKSFISNASAAAASTTGTEQSS